MLPLAAPFLVAGCSGPFSTLEPAGPGAGSIADLWWVMLAGSAILLGLVMTLFAMVMWRPDWGRRVPASRWIVLGGLVLPALVLPPLVGYALFAGDRLVRGDTGHAIRIEAEARQWHWRFSYPDQGDRATQDQLYLPAGQDVDITITSRDVIHSFWVPRLAGKRDAIPGHETVMRLRADEPGTLSGICAEFCGSGHTGMRFAVTVVAEEEFEDALMEATP